MSPALILEGFSEGFPLSILVGLVLFIRSPTLLFTRTILHTSSHTINCRSLVLSKPIFTFTKLESTLPPFKLLLSPLASSMGQPDPRSWDMATQSLFAGLQLLPHESGPPVECELCHDEAEDSHEVYHDRTDRSPAPSSSSSDKSSEIISSQDSSGATSVSQTDVGLPSSRVTPG